MWYGAQISIDENEKFEFFRDIAEHNAMFWNSEGVAQVREAREKTFKVNNNDFNSMLKNMFGHNTELPERQEEKIEEKTVEMSKRKMRSDLNPQSYLDVELDEIKFTPF